MDYAFKMKLLSQLNPLSSAKSKKFPEKLADAFTRKTKKKLESPKTLKWKQYIRIIPRQTYCRWCKNWQTFFVLLQLFFRFFGHCRLFLSSRYFYSKYLQPNEVDELTFYKYQEWLINDLKVQFCPKGRLKSLWFLEPLQIQ